VRQLGRFLRLERARKECEHEVPAPRRFETLEKAAVSAPVSPHPSPGLERFAPEPAPPLELETPDADQPFIRCMHCGADSVRHATVCRQCEARLDSEETRLFNVRLWAEMTAARAREVEELRRLEESRRGEGVSDVKRLTEEFAAREEARRALETPSLWTSRGWLGWTPVDGARAPRVVVALLVAVPILLSFSRHGTFLVGLVLAIGLGVLVTFASRRAR